MSKAKITDFTPDRNNANKGTEKGAIVLDDSISELGLGRSILVDKNGNIIAGNKTQETAVQNGLEDAIIVETDGSQLVVVKRTDLDLYSETDDKARMLGIYDNRSSELNLSWDTDNLDALFQTINSDKISVQAALSELATDNGLYFVSGDSWDEAFERLPDSDRAPFQQKTYTLHDEQIVIVDKAMTLAKTFGDYSDGLNENSNGNALARICEMFIEQNG